ncbi:MAG: phospholipase D-like domain-containing protein [Opitutales bacterium]|jgi:cardiolipin synthase
MPEIFAIVTISGLSEGTHWLILLAQSAAFIISVAIILRLAHEKRAPSNIFAWSLLLLFMPLVGVPLYLMFGGRKIRRLVGEKVKILKMARAAARKAGIFEDPCCAISGNKVTLLKDGVEAYRAFCKEIDHAKESIHIATFILGNDSVGRSIVRRLASRAKAGVQVRLLIDALGSIYAPASALRLLRKAGGQVHYFIPLSPFVAKVSANLRNHRKIAIFDNVRAIVGGQNMDRRFLSPTYSKTLFADLGLCVEGPAVAAMTSVFVGDWAFAGKHDVQSLTSLLDKIPPVCGQSDIEVIASGPDVEGDLLWERIISLVQEARASIVIVTPYFIPDEVLLRSLIIKAHAGRNVRIIVPETSNHFFVDLARDRFLRQMHAQGIEILFYKKRMLHAKLIIVDGRYAISGSANIDPRSFFVNFEIGFVHSSPSDLKGFADWMDGDLLPRCIPYARSRKARQTRLRLLGENLAHLLTPLL